MFSIKVTIIAIMAISCVLAAPQFGPQPIYNRGGFVPIVSQHYDLNPDQSYSFAYQSGDGSARNEVGVPRAAGPEGPAVTVQGSYSYNSPQGPIQVSYIADENGYQPTGNNIHPAIIKAVAQQVAQARATPYNPNNPNNYYG